jgi:hypothetical protein
MALLLVLESLRDKVGDEPTEEGLLTEDVLEAGVLGLDFDLALGLEDVDFFCFDLEDFLCLGLPLASDTLPLDNAADLPVWCVVS